MRRRRRARHRRVDLAPVTTCLTAVADDGAPASLARRQLADLPGVLRAADRHGHGQRARSPTPCSGSRRCSSTCSGTTSPTASLVAFDRPEPTFRHEPIADVQGATATAAPDILRQQMGLVREVLDALGIADRRARRRARPTTSSPRSPTQAATRGDDVIIVTGDRDSYQLVEDPHVKVLYNRRGVSATTRSTTRPASSSAPASRRRSTPSTRRCAATRATTCPACPGVGEKTAAKLITTYGGLDGIFAHVDEQTPKLRAEPRRARGAGPQERSS